MEVEKSEDKEGASFMIRYVERWLGMAMDQGE